MKRLFKKNIVNGIEKEKALYLLSFSSFLVLMPLISNIGSGFSLWNGLLFDLYHFAVILFPGYVLCRLLIKVSTYLGTLLFSYVLGYSANLGLYVLVMLLKADKHLNLINVLYFVLMFLIYCLCVFIKGKPRFKEPKREELVMLMTVMSLLFLAKMICFSMNVLPPTTRDMTYNPDFLYWVDDVAAAMQSFPVKNIRNLGSNYYYHYFSAIQLAAIAKSLHISALQVTAHYSFIQSTVLLALAGVCLVRRLIYRTEFRWVALLLLFFSTGLEALSGVSYGFHMILMPMGFDIGMGFFMAYLYLWMLKVRRNRISFRYCLVDVLIIGVMTGIKAPCAAILVAVSGVVCVYLLFKKEFTKALAYGGVILAGFFAVAIVFLSGTLSKYQTSFSPEGLLRQSGGGILGGFLFYIFQLHPICILLILSGMIYAIYRREMRAAYVMAFSSIFIGALLGYFIHMYGGSEMYFPMTVMPIIVLLAGMIWDDLLYDKELRGYFQYAFLLLCFLATSAFFSADFDGVVSQYANRGYTVLLDRDATEIGAVADCTCPVTSGEYEAYEWIREHTAEDSLFLTDYLFTTENICVFPAFAERMSYRASSPEEEQLIMQALQGDETSMEALIPKYEYFLLHDRHSNDFVWKNNWGEYVYGNGSIHLYRVYDYKLDKNKEQEP